MFAGMTLKCKVGHSLYQSNLAGLRLTTQAEAAVSCQRSQEDQLQQASDQLKEEFSTWRMNVQCVSIEFEGRAI